MPYIVGVSFSVLWFCSRCCSRVFFSVLHSVFIQISRLDHWQIRVRVRLNLIIILGEANFIIIRIHFARRKVSHSSSSHRFSATTVIRVEIERSKLQPPPIAGRGRTINLPPGMAKASHAELIDELTVNQYSWLRRWT